MAALPGGHVCAPANALCSAFFSPALLPPNTADPIRQSGMHETGSAKQNPL